MNGWIYLCMYVCNCICIYVSMNVRMYECMYVQWRQLHWYDRLMRLDADGVVKKCRCLTVESSFGRGKSMKTWNELIKDDLRIVNLTKP